MFGAILEMVAAQMLDERRAVAARARLVDAACAADRCTSATAQFGHRLVLIGQRWAGVRYAPVAETTMQVRWEGGR